MPLNPPKIHFYGNNAICAKWLPWAQQEINKLTRYQGNYFHKKYMMNGGEVIIWLDNDGFNRRIYIQAAGLFGYEFITSHRQIYEFVDDPDEGSVYLRSERVDHLVTMLRHKDGTLDGRNYRGKAIKDDEVFNDALPRLLTAKQEWQELDGWWSQPGLDWFHLSYSDDLQVIADRQAKGERSGRMTYCLSNAPRYSDDFYLANIIYGRTFFSGDGIWMKRGRKPKTIPAAVTTSTDSTAGGNQGLASAIIDNEFLILASGVGYDYRFAVYHLPSNQQIEVQAPKPSWVKGKVRSVWHFSPDGRRAVSVQYDSDRNTQEPLNEVSRYKMGISEVIFLPAYNDQNGLLTCEIEVGFIHYDNDFQVVAVDYDLFDQRLLRLVQLKHHISPAIDPDGGGGDYDHHGVITLAHWHTVDLTEQNLFINPIPSRSRLMMNALMLQRDTDSGVVDHIDALINSSAPWEAHANCRGVEGHFSGLDLRIDAWAIAYVVAGDNAHADATGNDYYFKEFGIHGVQQPEKTGILPGERHNTGWVDGREYPVEVISSTIPAGYSEYKTGHSYWTSDLLWTHWDSPGNGLTPYARQHLFLSFHNNSQTSGFRISPEKHVALYAPPPNFNLASPSSYWTRNVELGANAGPLGLIFDHIEYFVDGVGVVVGTHEEVHNSNRIVNTFDFQEVGADGFEHSSDSLAPYGVWSI